MTTSTLARLRILIAILTTGALAIGAQLAPPPPPWFTNGNAGTNAGADFLGTTDNQPLVFRTFNQVRMQIGAAGGVAVPGAFNAGSVTATGTVSAGNVAATGNVDAAGFTQGGSSTLSNNISGNAATATTANTAATATALAVDGINCDPGEYARGVDTSGNAQGCTPDADTTYTAGSGLALTGATFSADFAGSGSANKVARSDHSHDLADGAVTTAKLADGSVTKAKIAPGVVSSSTTSLTYASKQCGAFSTTSTDWTDVTGCSLGINVNQPSVLSISFAGTQFIARAGGGECYVRVGETVSVDGVDRTDLIELRYGSNLAVITIPVETPASFAVLVPVGAGVHTVTLRVRTDNAFSCPTYLGTGIGYDFKNAQLSVVAFSQ
jgi:hypothetical protein